MFTFCHVNDHRGPLKPGDKEHNWSCHNISIEWKMQESLLGNHWPSQGNEILHRMRQGTWSVEQAWMEFEKCACKTKTLQCWVNNTKHTQRFGQLVCNFCAHIYCHEKEAIVSDCNDGNAHWQCAIEAETGQLFEHKAFKDLGKNLAKPKGH